GPRRALPVRDLRAPAPRPGPVGPPHDRRAGEGDDRAASVTWSHEDGGPQRRQLVPGGELGVAAGGTIEVTTRVAPVTTMAVAPRHPRGARSPCSGERIAPGPLEPIERSLDLPGGPVWPGGLGVAPDGTVHVVFGNHAHHLASNLAAIASRRLPRDRPYNSFV